MKNFPRPPKDLGTPHSSLQVDFRNMNTRPNSGGGAEKRLHVFHWNPQRRRYKKGFLSRLPIFKRPNNFGDMLGPKIIDALLRQRQTGQKPNFISERREGEQMLLGVGSVLHFGRDGDIVWGAGKNGRIPNGSHEFNSLDVRMVRGPLTRDFLKERDIAVPDVFGDPGLLVAHLFPDLTRLAKKFDLTIIPNLNDCPLIDVDPHTLQDPTDDLLTVLRRIASSELVISSSLHGIVVSESLGIPVKVLRPAIASDFKYLDYFLGTGRSTPPPMYDSIKEAIKGESSAPPDFCAKKMIDAFPFDLF